MIECNGSCKGGSYNGKHRFTSHGARYGSFCRALKDTPRVTQIDPNQVGRVDRREFPRLAWLSVPRPTAAHLLRRLAECVFCFSRTCGAIKIAPYLLRVTALTHPTPLKRKRRHFPIQKHSRNALQSQKSHPQMIRPVVRTNHS